MIHLCFLWHMHQPFYKDLISGEYRLPWTRLHALKDYYGMAHILQDFPEVRQTFNLVPSMMVQVDEYARGLAIDPLLECVLKPAADLVDRERAFLLENSFHANPERLIYRYPRYRELYEMWESSQRKAERARRVFTPQALRDLQVLSQIAWFDEEFLDRDEAVHALVAKGRDFSLDDQAVMGEKQLEILGRVIPEYRRLAGSGQIEISTTPYYHPILPLLCDSEIAGVSHPGLTLPSRFRYPEDARCQLEMAREYVTRNLGGKPPDGLWPSEGSVSDEAFALAADAGFKWAATDNGVLNRTLGHAVGVEAIYRPYQWRQGGRAMHVIFRDHFLSDLIGFVYSRMGAVEAAEDFLHRIRENCRGILASGRDALVPIILDGENAWEYYDRNGRPFLRELYGRISRDPRMRAVTVSEALERIPSETLGHIFPGSWISANFDIWIGAEEDNKAWEYLLRARQTYERASGIPEDRRKLAYEELLIAEGSDWCWWYGPEHDSAQRAEFDQLYRDHLANVYRAMDLPPPEELSRPILQSVTKAFQVEPAGSVHPHIDGDVSSYFEWLGAGQYKIDERSGAMHGRRVLVRDVYFGGDGARLYLRVDFADLDLGGLEMRLNLQNPADSASTASALVRLSAEQAWVAEARDCDVEAEYRRILEVGVTLEPLGIAPGGAVRFQFSLWHEGLPMDAVPQQGWLELPAGG